ncbi:MAG: hypothetical protein KAS07_03050 [Candidatus Pacebacteria bacterium]|nr:hypothetical protein [Candidatus Paceibacterota bacterium]
MAEHKFKVGDHVEFLNPLGGYAAGVQVVSGINEIGDIHLNGNKAYSYIASSLRLVEGVETEEEEEKRQDSDPKAEGKCVQIQAYYIPLIEKHNDSNRGKKVYHEGHSVLVRLYDNGDVTRQIRSETGDGWQKEYEVPAEGVVNNS